MEPDAIVKSVPSLVIYSPVSANSIFFPEAIRRELAEASILHTSVDVPSAISPLNIVSPSITNVKCAASLLPSSLVYIYVAPSV